MNATSFPSGHSAAIAAFGIFVTAYGLVYIPGGWVAVGIGVAIALMGFFGWSLEPVTREGSHD